MTTITLPRATVEQALEALYEETAWFGPTPKGAAAIDALRAALAQQDEPVEPVAWAAVTENGKLYKAASTRESAERKAEQQEAKFGDTWRPLHVVPLYATPPQRKPLTEEEIDAEWRELDGEVSTMFMRVLRKFARAVERAVWEKNHG